MSEMSPLLFRWRQMQGVLLFLLLAGTVMAQAQDKPGGRDHQVVGRYAGSVLANYGEQQHEQIQAPLGRGSLEVYRNYEQALKDKGFTIVFGCDQPQCGDGASVVHISS
jgi:hypothetical protein